MHSSHSSRRCANCFEKRKGRKKKKTHGRQRKSLASLEELPGDGAKEKERKNKTKGEKKYARTASRIELVHHSFGQWHHTDDRFCTECA